MKRITKSNRLSVTGYGLVEIKRFKNISKTFFLKNNFKFLDYIQFFDYSLKFLICKLKELTLQTSLKINLHVDSVYENVLTMEKKDFAFKTNNELVCKNSNFPQYF